MASDIESQAAQHLYCLYESGQFVLADLRGISWGLTARGLLVARMMAESAACRKLLGLLQNPPGCSYRSPAPPTAGLLEAPPGSSSCSPAAMEAQPAAEEAWHEQPAAEEAWPEQLAAEEAWHEQPAAEEALHEQLAFFSFFFVFFVFVFSPRLSLLKASGRIGIRCQLSSCLMSQMRQS